MRNAIPRGILAGVLLLVIAAPALAQTPAEAQTRSRLGRLLETTAATPGQRGLVTVAVAEAQTALAQAVQAEKAADDLAAMRAAGAGLLHALDPSRQATGPGLGPVPWGTCWRTCRRWWAAMMPGPTSSGPRHGR